MGEEERDAYVKRRLKGGLGRWRMAGWAREPWGLWRRMLRRTWWASCDGERIYEVYRSFKRALDQHALFMNLLCCCWLSDNVLRIELMDWARLKIRCGVSRGFAANQDLTWESPVRTTNYGHRDMSGGFGMLLYCSFACTKITP